MFDRWNASPPILKGTILMLLSAVSFSILLVLIRVVGQAVPVVLVIVARQVVMQLVIFAQAGRGVRTILRTNSLRLQLWRAVFALGSTVATYVTFIYLPLALASAISFTTALFVTIGAAVFLKEHVAPKTWAATLIGLVGVYIMLSPTEQGSMPFVLLAIAGAVLSAGMILSVRGLDPAESVGTVLTYQGILILPALIVPLFLTWQMPTPNEWLALLAIGIIGTLGQWTLVGAYRHAEAARLAPLDFLRLVLIAAAGLVFFDEHLEPSLIAGMLIIVATTLYTIRANSALKIQEVPALP
ncbi:MAG: eamA-like transporter family protein [Devosia sp.]|uniref:DMT family transporter n=1 Tax=Devosia sp. TaxID=1871048 RepID=UPI002603F380|nr:DMT family transporter [Devosia sp.]MDB5529910.1 eamA-like transporter family protein [Devosia sp.]